MKRTRFFKVLAAAVVLALLMIAVPVTPALAAPAITLSASTGPTGTVITVTTAAGSEFTANTPGWIWFDSDGGNDRDTGEPQVSVTTTGTGALPAGVTLTVPTVPRATYRVQADIPIDATIEAYNTFAVTPEITLDDADGYVGDTISVDGTGFAASAGITILYDNVSKTTATAGANGTFSNATFAAPASVKGSHNVKAQETSATSNNDTATFTVSPKITISPTSGAVGDEVTVTGTGFDDDSDITIYFDSGSEDITDGDDETDSNGGFQSTFIVPGATRGSHTVKAQDDSSNQATATFAVGQKITINPTSGPSGTTVTVTGTGFKPSQPITVKYNNVSVTTNPSPVTTNSTGYFTATFSALVLAAGTYEVSASDGTNTATANFVSTTTATINPVTSASSPGYVGMELTITGIGFTPSHEITITYASEVIFEDTITSLADGSFSYILTVPTSEHGAHVITVSDGTITKTFDFFMEENPPPTPGLTLPLAGEKIEDWTFTWEAVEDSENDEIPVTYDLQLSTSANFSTTLINEAGLEDPTYTIPAAQELESAGKDAPYYWRVRAVDAASNPSDWSDPSTFTVGFSFELTGWVLWVVMAAIAVVFFIIGLFVGRRAGGGGYY